MTYQPVGPENRASASPLQADDIFYFVRVALFVWVLSSGYVLSHPPNKTQTLLLRDSAGSNPPDRDWSDLPQWQQKASQKAAVRYAETQRKKWRRWNDAMFERSE